MTAADLVALALPDSARRQLLISHAAGPGAQRALGLVLPAEASLSWEVLATGQPARVEDFRHDERVARGARENLDLGPAILFPLGGPGDARGVLTVGRHPGGMPLDQAAAELVTTFAAQAGIALELAERRRDAERLAVLRRGARRPRPGMTWAAATSPGTRGGGRPRRSWPLACPAQPPPHCAPPRPPPTVTRRCWRRSTRSPRGPASRSTPRQTQ